MDSRAADGPGNWNRILRWASGAALLVGVVVSLVMLATVGEVIVTFLLVGVLPTVLGYLGLARAGALPAAGRSRSVADEDVDLVEELKRKYAAGEIGDDELERKMEALMAAEEGTTGPGRGRSSTRSREREYDTLR